MKVKELIEKLQEYDGEYEVFLTNDDGKKYKLPGDYIFTSHMSKNVSLRVE